MHCHIFTLKFILSVRPLTISNFSYGKGNGNRQYYIKIVPSDVDKALRKYPANARRELKD